MKVPRTPHTLAKLATGALLALAGATILIGDAGAASTPTASSFVAITPCRLADTRASDQVGTRGAPIGGGESVTFQVRGTNGKCTIPNSAVGIATNTTTVNPTAESYLTVWPADADKPLASNLNWVPTSPPTPNQVTVGLSSAGAIKVFNLAGTVNVIIDIVGYYLPLPAPPAPVAQVPPTAFASTRATQVPLSASGGPNGAVTVNPMFLPAGTYLVTFTATVVNFSTATDYFRCTIYAVGVNKAANAVLLGPTVGPVVPMTVQAVVTLTSGGTAAVGSACQHDTNLPTGGTNVYYLDPGATLTALPIVNGGTAAP